MGAVIEDAPVRRLSTSMAEVVIEVLWNQGPNASDGDWCDITPYVTHWWFEHGRENELEDFSAGNGQVEVETFDRLFDSSYTSGPFYPWLTVNRQIRIFEVLNDGTRNPCGRGYIRDYGDTIEGDRKYTTTISFADGFERGEHITLPPSFYELIVSQDRPDHWWHLDEGSGAGTALDGGYSTSPAQGLPTATSFGETAIVPFDGGRTCASVTNGQAGVAALGMPTQSTWTIEFWASTTYAVSNSPATSQRSFIGSGTGNTPSSFFVGIFGGPSHVATVNVWTASGVVAATSTAFDVNDGVAHHYVITWIDSTRTIALYVDGALIGSSNAASGSFAASANQPLWMGGAPPYSTPQDNAEVFISNVAVYDGRVLSAAQILAHYTAGATAYSGDDTGTHLSRILDYVGWPTSLRSIDTGSSLVGANDLDGGNLASFIRSMGSTELGQTYFDLDGKLVHRSRHNVVLDTRSSSVQGTFGDATSGEACKYIEDGFEFPLDNTQLRNPVRASRRGGTTAVARDQTLIDDTYGDNSYDAPESLDGDDNVMTDRAGLILDRWKQPVRWLSSMTIDPTMDVTNLQPQLQRKIGDRITAKRTPLATGNEIQADILIQKVRHEGSQGTRLATFAGTAAEARRYWILGDATYGLLGQTTVLGY